MGGREDVEAAWVPSGGVRKPWRRSAVSNSSFSTARSHHGSQSRPGSRGCPEDQTRSRGGRQAGPTHPLGDVWCPDEDKHTGRGPALDAHAPGARPSTLTPQGPGPRRPRPRRRGGEAGRLPGSAHSLACSRIDCASTTTCQARGSCWDSRASETPPRTNVPPEWDSRRPGGRSTDCPHCGCPSMLPHGRSERDPRPACPLGSAPQHCLCTGVTPPVGRPR